MSSAEQQTDSSRGYRVRPTVVVGAAMIVLHTVVVFGLQFATGLSYNEWFATAENGVRAGLIPLGVGAVLLIAFLAYARWDMVWRDPERLPLSTGMKTALWFFLVAIVLRLVFASWGEIDLELLLVIVGAGILVGFAEETLFRGIVLRTLRTGGRSEARAVIWTSIAFGLFHLPNLLTGVGAIQVAQIVVAALTGGILYLWRRYRAFILPAMVGV